MQSIFRQLSLPRPSAWLCILVLLSFSALALEFDERLLGYVEQKFGLLARKRFTDLQLLLQTNQSQTDVEKLNQVNQFYNRIRFVSDQRQWGAEDYWATPVEFLAHNAGDCEDFSIAKYFALKQLGVDEEKMRITYVRAVQLNQAHMVLAYYETPNSDPLILDNLINEIRPGSKRPDLVPIYSFNGKGLWLAKQRGKGKKIGQASKLEHWASMNKRLLDELEQNPPRR